jgi:heptosyltransferase I
MNILILRVSAIGDVIHTLPAIFLIKKTYPNAKISWVVQKKAANLLLNQPFLENVWVLPNKFLSKKNWKTTLKIIKQLRKTKWDAILDFQGLLKTSALLLFLRGKKYGFDFNNARLWATTFFTNKHTTPLYTNIIQKNLALVSDMLQHKQPKKFKSCPTIDSLKSFFKLKVCVEEKEAVDNWLQKSHIEKFIALAPNTTWPSKHWPENNWETLFNQIQENQCLSNNYSILLIGKDFGKQAKNLAQHCIEKNLSVYTTPNWNLLTTSYLISKSSLLIAPDTGLLHIADFLDTKSIGIFGPTSAKKHGPFLKNSNIANAIQIECPHYYQKTHGENDKKNKNSGKQQNCMYKLSSQDLLNKISQILIE